MRSRKQATLRGTCQLKTKGCSVPKGARPKSILNSTQYIRKYPLHWTKGE